MKSEHIEQLKQSAAAIAAHAEGRKIQARERRGGDWYDVTNPDFYNFDFAIADYRPRPEPVRRPWSKPEDVPGPVCWIRSVNFKQSQYLVSAVMAVGAWTANGCGNQLWEWNRLGESDIEYSTDRKTWSPCTVEEVA